MGNISSNDSFSHILSQFSDSSHKELLEINWLSSLVKKQVFKFDKDASINLPIQSNNEYEFYFNLSLLHVSQHQYDKALEFARLSNRLFKDSDKVEDGSCDELLLLETYITCLSSQSHQKTFTVCADKIFDLISKMYF